MKRTVVFYRDLSIPSMLFSYVLSENDSVSAFLDRDPELVYLTHTEVDIPEIDTADLELKALGGKLEKERQEFEDKSIGLTMRINELREKRHEQAS